MTLPAISALPTPPSRRAPATFSDDADTFLGALPNFRDELNAFAEELPNAVSGIDYNGTSATSVAIGTGAKAFVIETGKLIQTGQFLNIASTASPANYMYGRVVSYNAATGSLSMEITATVGAGTFAAWTVSLAPSVDALPRAGGTMTGSLTLAGAPTSGLHAATKAYVDAAVPSAGSSLPSSGLTSAALRAALTDETGTGAAVFATAPTISGGTFTSPTISGASISGSTLTTATLNSPTLTTPALGTPSAGNLQNCTVDGTNSPGARRLPQSAATTAAIGDVGKHIYNGTGLTVPAGVFSAGDAFSYVNSNSSPVTITQGGGVTMYLAGTSATGNRTLAGRGMVTILCVAPNVFMVGGAGLS
jgi:hypothetical protein